MKNMGEFSAFLTNPAHLALAREEKPLNEKKLKEERQKSSALTSTKNMRSPK